MKTLTINSVKKRDRKDKIKCRSKFSVFSHFQLNSLLHFRHVHDKAQELREKSQAQADSISSLEEKVSRLSDSFDRQEEKLKIMISDSEAFQNDIKETNAAFQMLERKVLSIKTLDF